MPNAPHTAEPKITVKALDKKTLALLEETFAADISVPEVRRHCQYDPSFASFTYGTEVAFSEERRQGGQQRDRQGHR